MAGDGRLTVFRTGQTSLQSLLHSCATLFFAGHVAVQVMQHMSKCFQAIGKLKLDTDTPAPGQRPRGLGMISCVGEEYVPFKSPLPLVDKVCRTEYTPHRASLDACMFSW